MAHIVEFTPRRGPDKGKRIRFKAKGPAPKPGGKYPDAKRGDCKRVRMRSKGRGSCTIELCYTGSGPTGWKFKKNSQRCSR